MSGPQPVTLAAAISPGGDLATLGVTAEGAHVVAQLDAHALDEWIMHLGRAREALTAEPVPDLEPGARLGPWVVRADWQVVFGGGNVALALRHPGFGWLPFALTAQEARQLAEQLGAAAQEGP